MVSHVLLPRPHPRPVPVDVTVAGGTLAAFRYGAPDAAARADRAGGPRHHRLLAGLGRRRSRPARGLVPGGRRPARARRVPGPARADRARAPRRRPRARGGPARPQRQRRAGAHRALARRLRRAAARGGVPSALPAPGAGRRRRAPARPRRRGPRRPAAGHAGPGPDPAEPDLRRRRGLRRPLPGSPRPRAALERRRGDLRALRRARDPRRSPLPRGRGGRARRRPRPAGPGPDGSTRRCAG